MRGYKNNSFVQYIFFKSSIVDCTDKLNYRKKITTRSPKKKIGFIQTSQLPFVVSLQIQNHLICLGTTIFLSEIMESFGIRFYDACRHDSELNVNTNRSSKINLLYLVLTSKSQMVNYRLFFVYVQLMDVGQHLEILQYTMVSLR